MRLLLLAVLIGVSLACRNRLETLVQEVAGHAGDLSTDVHDDCNSKVGTFTSEHSVRYKSVINKVLSLAFKYMAVSSHFGRDTVQRPGFQKLFRESSDERFQEAVDMIKYVVKRGGNVKGSLNVQLPVSPHFQPQPLPSLGLALNDTKDLYAEKERLHRAALCLNQNSVADCTAYDPDLAHQSQDALESEVERAHQLASKANQLATMFTITEHSLAEDRFDQHLQ